MREVSCPQEFGLGTPSQPAWTALLVNDGRLIARVFAVRQREWRSRQEGRAGRLRLPCKHRGEQARDGDLLPSRWNQIGFAASGPLATADQRVPAAGHSR